MSGRPSKYESDVKPKIKFIPALITAGFSNKDIALFLGINEDTLYEYKKKYPEFSECLEKRDLIAQVEETYFNRLTGKYKAVREIEERDKKTGDMVLVRRERYEIPLNEGAYKHYLATLSPTKWQIGTPSDVDKDINLNIKVMDLTKEKKDG